MGLKRKAFFRWALQDRTSPFYKLYFGDLKKFS